MNYLVTSYIDYCNSTATLNKIHTVKTLPPDLSPGLLTASTSLPRWRIFTGYQFITGFSLKRLVITYKALQGQSPVYIRNLLHVYIPTRNVRSQNNATVLVVPKSRKVMFDDRSFATTALRLWNTLTEGIRDSSSLANFKTSLKTHVYVQIYGQKTCWFVFYRNTWIKLILKLMLRVCLLLFHVWVIVTILLLLYIRNSHF